MYFCAVKKNNNNFNLYEIIEDGRV